MLYRLKLQDTSSLVGEVRQAAAMSPVDVLIGNTEEASKMVEMMNKNVAAFLYYVTLEWDMDESFIKTLLSKTVDPELVADIVNCTWDKKTQTLCTPKDGENEKQKNIKDSAWYKNKCVSQLTKKEAEEVFG